MFWNWLHYGSLFNLSDKGVNMELLDIDTIQVLLKYGSFALTFGIVIIISFELFIFGVVKAISFFRL